MGAVGGCTGDRGQVNYRIDSSTQPQDAHRATILNCLRAFNAQHAVTSEDLAVLLRDANDQLAGGLWGRCVCGWLCVELLFVPEAARGQGLGTRLLAAAEAQASARGCVGVWLYTFEFQAVRFYQLQGYQQFAQLQGPAVQGRHFFLKYLQAQ